MLFVGEAATLAHIARPLVLAGMLDSERFVLHFACDASVRWLLAGFRGTTHLLPSLGSAHFIQALARGKPLFDEATLERYVADDLKLLTLLAPGPHREAAQRLARQSAAFTAAVDFGAILTRIVER